MKAMIKDFFRALKWEVLLSFKGAFKNKIGLLMDFVIFTWTYIAVYYYNVNGAFAYYYGVSETEAKVLVIIGYIFWQNASAALGYCKSTVQYETSNGIFESRLQSVFPMEIIWFGQLVANCIVHIVSFAGVIAFGIFVGGFDMRDILIVLGTVFMSFIPLIGMYGIGMIFGSMHVIGKDISSFIIVFQTILLLVSNALSPTRGNWVYLLPFSSGIEIMRNIYVKQAVNMYLVVVFVIVNIVWYIIGCVCYRYALLYEKRTGSFSRY